MKIKMKIAYRALGDNLGVLSLQFQSRAKIAKNAS